jgi:hypothetical protein
MEKAGGHLITIPQSEITVEDGSDNVARVALTDQVRALDKTRLRRKFGFISVRAIYAINLGLDYLFGDKPIPRAATASTTPAKSASAAPAKPTSAPN